MLTKGFSLIELMVVIAIVAMLAAVAVPSYMTYQSKTKLNSVYVVMQDFAQQLATQYQTTGAWPNTMTFGGITFGPSYTTTSAGTGTSPIISGVPIDSIAYKINNGYTNNTIAYIQAVVDASVGSWVSSGNTAFKYAVSVNTTTGITTYPCGQWPTGDSRDVPTTYMPSSCTCNSMSSYSGGSGTTAPCG